MRRLVNLLAGLGLRIEIEFVRTDLEPVEIGGVTWKAARPLAQMIAKVLAARDRQQDETKRTIESLRHEVADAHAKVVAARSASEQLTRDLADASEGIDEARRAEARAIDGRRAAEELLRVHQAAIERGDRFLAHEVEARTWTPGEGSA